MALNLKSLEVEKLAQEVANLTGSTKTEAIRQALLEKKQRLEATEGEIPNSVQCVFLKIAFGPSFPHRQTAL